MKRKRRKANSTTPIPIKAAWITGLLGVLAVISVAAIDWMSTEGDKGTQIEFNGTASNVNQAETIYIGNNSTDADLRIVDLGLIPPGVSAVSFPGIDIKLRNTGSKAAFITEARIEILEKVFARECAHFAYEPINWEYHYNLDVDESISLSQVVQGQGTDRFSIVVGHNITDPALNVFYRVKLILKYNESGSVLESVPFSLYVPGMAQSVASSNGADLECAERLEENLNRVKSWPVSYSFPDYLSSIR